MRSQSGDVSLISCLLRLHLHLFLILDLTLSRRPDLQSGSWGGGVQKYWKKRKQLFSFVFSSLPYSLHFFIGPVGIRNPNPEGIQMPSFPFLPTSFFATSLPAEPPPPPPPHMHSHFQSILRYVCMCRMVITMAPAERRLRSCRWML